MQNITSIAGLKNSIRLLEVEQGIKGCQLKDQIYLTYESLKPNNLIRNTLKELFSSKYLIKNISGTVMGAASGFLLNKFFNGVSSSKLKKLAVAVLQFGITNLINQYPDQIRTFGQAIFEIFSTRMKWMHAGESGE